MGTGRAFSTRPSRSPVARNSRVCLLSIPDVTFVTANPHISIVIPFYNEAESLDQLQSQLTKVMTGYDHEILFVDDGSNDNSLQMIHRFARIRILTLSKQIGQSAAMFVV